MNTSHTHTPHIHTVKLLFVVLVFHPLCGRTGIDLNIKIGLRALFFLPWYYRMNSSSHMVGKPLRTELHSEERAVVCKTTSHGPPSQVFKWSLLDKSGAVFCIVGK